MSGCICAGHAPAALPIPYAARMKELVDAFWRAAAYCLHPRVILWSLLPLAFALVLVLGLGWFYWESSVAGVRDMLEQWSLLVSLLQWLDAMGGGGFRAVLAPLIVVALAVPLIVVAALLLVAWLMTPALVRLVATRRFGTLQRKRGAAWCAAAALVDSVARWWRCLLLVLSLPLWFMPPLVLILPPLIWGWLTYRVMSFDVLAEHASTDERRQLLREHRWPLLAIGVVSGYLGAAPSLLWAAERRHAGLCAAAGAGVDLALHAGVRVRGAVVRAFRAGRAATLARWRRIDAACLTPALLATLGSLHRQRNA